MVKGKRFLADSHFLWRPSGPGFGRAWRSCCCSSFSNAHSAVRSISLIKELLDHERYPKAQGQ